MYRERPSRLPGAAVWTVAAEVGREVGRILPDGCTDLIWDGRQLLVAGPDTRAHLAERMPGVRYTGLRFPPGTGPAVFGLPAGEVRDRRVRLADVWSAGEARRLAERVAGAPDPGAALEALAAGRLRSAAGPDPLDAAVAGQLRAGRPVADVARGTGLSERQLHRRSLAAFGYGPKTLARVLRMVRALDLARRGEPLAAVAARTGYADQAHLTREVRSLTGLSPAALLRDG
jgi:AraC-like DNA-binding protein